jgi:hypothetical protein
MYFEKELTVNALEILVKEAEQKYIQCLTDCVLAEGALKEAQSELCRKILSSKRIYPRQRVMVRLNSNPSPVKMYYDRTESGSVLLRSYTPKGNLSTYIDRYPWTACHSMERID